MNAAICDADSRNANALKSLLTQINPKMRIDRFESASALPVNAPSFRYDLVFIDPDCENGFESAKRLSEVRPETGIVFTAANDAYALQAFGIQALHYLIKPCSGRELEEVFRRHRSTQASGNTLTLHIGRDIYTLFQRDIVKVESNRHHTIVSMVDGITCSVRRNFSDIISLLDERFITIKRGVTVNMSHVSRFNSTELLLSDGTKYLLRRDRRKDIRETYLQFVADRLKKKL
ncbi:MAG: LytTR family DNA-binding domain-containing protein [Lachnospiraceae bacterium]|nr:LytTR family DNA-binding domain-containing protein [Lachnospiraceae bacterium]